MIVTFTIWPYGKKHLSGDIAKVIKLIEESKLPHHFHSMGTNIEGEWSEVMDLIKRCRDKLLETNNRIGLSILIDDKKGAIDQISHKVISVKEKLENR
jgi:uncharacterized protein (TIGR00106 family)